MTEKHTNSTSRAAAAIVRMPEVLQLTGLSKATIYRMMKAGTFPKQYRLSERAVGWKQADLWEWADGRKVAA